MAGREATGTEPSGRPGGPAVPKRRRVPSVRLATAKLVAASALGAGMILGGLTVQLGVGKDPVIGSGAPARASTRKTPSTIVKTTVIRRVIQQPAAAGGATGISPVAPSGGSSPAGVAPITSAPVSVPAPTGVPAPAPTPVVSSPS